MNDSVDTLFFDLDRTLWDFEKNSAQTLNELYHEFDLKGHGCATFERFIEVYQMENKKCWDAYLAGRLTQAVLRPARYTNTLRVLGIENEQLGATLGEQYVQRSPRQKHLLPGALDVLADLKGRGHRIIILTNGFDEVQRIKVNNSGIAPFVDRVLTSDELGFKKPDARCFAAAFDIAECAPNNTWMIGDDFQADIMGAAAVGMRQVYFDRYGDRDEQQATTGCEPTVTIASLSELKTCF